MIMLLLFIQSATGTLLSAATVCAMSSSGSVVATPIILPLPIVAVWRTVRTVWIANASRAWNGAGAPTRPGVSNRPATPTTAAALLQARA